MGQVTSLEQMMLTWRQRGPRLLCSVSTGRAGRATGTAGADDTSGSGAGRCSRATMRAGVVRANS